MNKEFRIDRMILDTSAVIALVQKEEGFEHLIPLMEEAEILKISAVSVVEAGIVMQARYGDAGESEVDQFIRRLDISIIPVTEAQSDIARLAYRKFGKGRHPASLNFEDCFSYALASILKEPLLFVGDDFSKTDLPGLKD